MIDLFTSARLTLDRAQHHINDFDATFNAFLADDPWTLLIDRQAEPGRSIFKVYFRRKLPEILPCIVFDAANNLRAVLDQIGYAVAVASGNANPKKTSFPFGDDAKSVDNCIAGWCKDIPPEIRVLFRSFNPYLGGNDSLWALNKLCNTKKHCALVPLAMNNFTTEIVTFADKSAIITNVAPTWNPNKFELTLFSVASEIESDIRGNFAFEIALDGVQTLTGKSAIGVLNTMSSIVESVLMATEWECRRLKLGS
jgi:hypothetical protein